MRIQGTKGRYSQPVVEGQTWEDFQNSSRLKLFGSPSTYPTPTLTIRALCVIGDNILNDMNDTNDINDINLETYSYMLSTSAITGIMIGLVKKEELDIDLDDITSRRVGRILGKMRFIKNRASGSGTRQWRIRISDLVKWARSYGLDIPESFCYQGG